MEECICLVEFIQSVSKERGLHMETLTRATFRSFWLQKTAGPMVSVHYLLQLLFPRLTEYTQMRNFCTQCLSKELQPLQTPVYWPHYKTSRNGGHMTPQLLSSPLSGIEKLLNWLPLQKKGQHYQCDFKEKRSSQLKTSLNFPFDNLICCIKFSVLTKQTLSHLSLAWRAHSASWHWISKGLGTKAELVSLVIQRFFRF